MPFFDYKTALVTGASGGIGAAVVRRLRDQGLRVHAVARRADRLQALAADTGCIPHALDLLDSDAIYALVAEAAPDVIVNNAGLAPGMGRGLHEHSRDMVATTIGVNVLALAQVVHAALPRLRAQGGGHIINVGSVSGLYPIGAAVYGATKGAVRLFGQNLRLDLAGSGVRVTEICPGRVDTEFFDAANADPALRARISHEAITPLSAADVADAILYALNAPWHVNISTIELAPVEQVYGGARFVPAAGA